jgi:2'-5' RNA ligase
MHGLVSLLDQKHTRQVEELWNMLDEKCGLTGIQVTPFPHFSWLIASDFDWTALENALQNITSNASPFTVHTTGLGLFSGVNPVIFVPVVKTARLSEFHLQVWDSIQPYGTDISPLYAPDNWVPHISLAYADVTQETIPCVMQRLAFQTYNWEIRVDNISFIHEPDGHVGEIRYEFELKGDK